MRMIKKQAAKLEELEARRERLVNRVAKLDLKIEEQKEKTGYIDRVRKTGTKESIENKVLTYNMNRNE